jgi:phosphate acetyltransferase
MAGKHEKYQRLLEFCKNLSPMPTAVAHPCDDSSLEAAVGAAKIGIIAPILIGPRARIEAVAKEYRIDIGGLPIEDTAHKPRIGCPGVEIVREARAEALMKVACTRMS